MAVARSEVTELALSLLDGIPELGLSQAGLSWRQLPKGCNMR